MLSSRFFTQSERKIDSWRLSFAHLATKIITDTNFHLSSLEQTGDNVYSRCDHSVTTLKTWYISGFGEKHSQCVKFWIEKNTKRLILIHDFYNASHFESNFLQRVRFRKRILGSVRFWIQSFKPRQILKYVILNTSEIAGKFAKKTTFKLFLSHENNKFRSFVVFWAAWLRIEKFAMFQFPN